MNFDVSFHDKPMRMCVNLEDAVLINGKDGKSAYEVAVANGFEGTEAEWLESLHGEDGIDGKDGAPGRDGIDGKDYILTEADKQEIAEQAAELIDVPEGGGGTNDHNELTNRDAADQHPIEAITGLADALKAKLTKDDVDLVLAQAKESGEFDGKDGKDGLDGQPGKDGQDGYTPVKGKDYYTEADKAELVEEVLEQIPEQPSGGISVDKAEIGQTIVVKAVDENGKPTEWEAADLPAGGGSSVQSDWNQNDSTKPDYIKNRTHYEIPPAFEPIRWDGNMDGHFALDMSALGYEEGLYYVKVSDLVLAVDKIVDTTILLNSGDEVVVSNDFIFHDMFPGAYLVGEYLVVVQEQSLLNSALGLPDGYITNGTYFMLNNGVYVSALTSKGQPVKIDKKFLPDAIQPDWNQNDESQPDYVKNRPFYEVPRIYDITWDGDMTGRTALDLSVLGADGAYLVKVSDKVYTKEELVGKFFVNPLGDGICVNTEDVFVDIVPGAFSESDYLFGIVFSADEFNAAVGAPDGYYTNGTYFLCAPSFGTYTSAIYTEGRIEKMKDKFLPDTALRRVYIDIPISDPTNKLSCVLDGGWSERKVTWGKESPWGESPQQLYGKELAVTVSVEWSKHIDFITYVVFSPVRNSSAVGSGYCNISVGGTDALVQVFIRILDGGTIYVAAKTVDTKPSLTAADMDTIAQNVIAKLPIYNGEVESV